MAEGSEPNWSVVAIARENPEVIKRFVAWHLHAGAKTISLFFDDPNDPCIGLVAHLPQVSAVACTPAFWTEIGLTQDTRFTKRQNRACRSGYDAAPQGWVLNIDADELLYIEGQSVGSYLAGQRDDCRSILIEPAERVLINGDEENAAFRSITPRHVIEEVYGDTAGFVIRNHGLVGHDIGKSILRTGLGKFWLRQHFGQLNDGEHITDLTIGPETGAMLLHFFSRGYDDWRRKLDYRLANRGFRHRIRGALQAARDAGDEDLLVAHYATLHHLSARQAEQLTSAGFLHRPRLDIDAKISRYFPSD